jgi:hypothetical protein
MPSASATDLVVYDIADNLFYQITSTPGVNETLSDISVLDNGDVRVVWAADDGPVGKEMYTAQHCTSHCLLERVRGRMSPFNRPTGRVCRSR